MSSDFEWRMEDEAGDWDRPASPRNPERPPRPPSLFLVTGLLLLVAAGIWLFRQVDGRVAEAESELEAEVLALQRMIEGLARQPDDELFRSLLSGRDRSWVEAQSRLLQSHRLLDRPDFGLSLQSGAGPVQVTLAPDLRAAELVASRTFLADLGDGRQQLVTLEQTMLARQGEHRWLYSPPDQEFWGEWQLVEESILALVYPARDEALAIRLAADLEAKIQEMCHALSGINCPPDWRVWVRLETDPNSLLKIADLPSLMNSRYVIELPAPSLVGLPADEAAYQALFRGYGSRLLSILIPRSVGYQCCWRGLFFRALLDKQLSLLELQPWPLDQAEYDALMRRPFRWTKVYDRWNDDSLQFDENWPQIYSLIDFVQDQHLGAAPLAAMQRDLLSVPGRYLGWVQNYMPQAYDLNRLTADWLRFIYSQTTSGKMAEPPLPLPRQRLQLVCGLGLGETAMLYQYDLNSRRQEREFARRGIFGLISPLTNGDYLVYQRVYDSDRVDSRTLIWRDEEEILVSELRQDGTDPHRGLYFLEEDPTGRYSVLVAFGDPGQLDRHFLLDLAQCQGGGCQMRSLLSPPVWSADGSRTLQVDRSLPAANRHDNYHRWLQAPLYVGDDQGQERRLIGRGNLPFWLGSDLVGYGRIAGQDSPWLAEIVTTDPEENFTPSVLFSTSDLLAAIPAADRPAQLYILAIETQPTAGPFLSVTAAASPERGAGPGFVFLIELSPGLDALHSIALKYVGERKANAAFSPSGQWLTIFTNEAPGNVIHLFDLTNGSSTSIGSNGRWAGWAADGQWVAQRYDDYLTLLAPAFDYQQVIFQDFSDCRAVGWAPAS